MNMRVDRTMGRDYTTSPLGIVHVGQSALVLGFPVALSGQGDQVIVTRDSAGLMPGGICLDRIDFDRIHGAIVGRDPASSTVDMSAWTDQTVTISRVDLRLDITAFPPRRIYNLRSAVSMQGSSGNRDSLSSPDIIRRRAPAFAHDALMGAVHVDSLRALVGAGPGTTPSGDDIIVGTLAGLRTLGLRVAWIDLGRQLEPLMSRTTSTSRHYLRAAIDGRFGEHVHDLVHDISEGESAEHILLRASTWGATSGTDLLAGLLATLIASLPHRTIERAA